jgi:signal transduction histidine kinase
MAEQGSSPRKPVRARRRVADAGSSAGDQDLLAETDVPRDLALLAAPEARQRLELLSAVSKVLDMALEDYREVARKVAVVCVPAFADLCAVELVGLTGELETVAYSVAEGTGMRAPSEWHPSGLAGVAPARPVLAFKGSEIHDSVTRARRRLNAQSLLVVPIAEGGITLGRLVLATGLHRRAFRPSAVPIGVEVASRLAVAVRRATLHLEMKAASREQAQAVSRLRRLATAAANLAGAASTRAVLRVACLEACAIPEADGAMARWWLTDGTVVEDRAGSVDEELAERAFVATAGRRLARQKGWVAYPLLPNQVRRRAALVIFVSRELSYDEELALASLVSLVPVAFERALGSGVALAQEARVRAVVSSSPVALVGLGPTGLVTLANPAAQLLFGWQEGRAPAVLPPSLQPAFNELSATVGSTGTVANRVVSAEPFELSLSAVPMPAIAGGGDELSVLVAATDLSEIRRAERSLVQAQRLDAMGLVAGRVAHDFNNVLTVIIGYTELLARSPGEDVRLAVKNISRAARRAASLTQQLLGLAGRRHEVEIAVDLAAELHDLRSVLERLGGDQVTVRISYPDRPVVVAMSLSGAEQVVLNLAINACQAMDDRGTLAIQLVTVKGDDARDEAAVPPTEERDPAGSGWAVITVADNGSGMSADVRAQCMEPFFTTKARGQGTGLGLPTVLALVTEGGGHMEIDSAPCQGTTITVWLPLSEGVPLAGEAEAVEVWPAGRVLSGRALLVEDEDEIRELGARALREAGLEVTCAGSAEVAAQVAGDNGPFNVLVTDVMLPGRSGLDLVRDLNAGTAALPVLLVTGYSQPAGPLLPPGPNAQVLRKPYRPEELVFAVAVMLGDEPARDWS